MPKLNLTIGATFNASFTCLDSAGDPVDLTGYTPRGIVKTSLDSDIEFYDLSPTIDAPETGVVNVEVSAENSLDFDASAYVWSVVLDTPESATITIGDGQLIAKRISTIPVVP